MAGLALVTGASSGIGHATTAELVAHGWRVIAMARREELLDALCSTLGDAVTAMPCDCGHGDEVLAAAEQVLAAWGLPDVIIHCAGAGQWKEIEDTSPSDLDAMMAAPFRAAFHVNHAFMGPMLKRGSGQLIHVNSPASVMPWGGATGYAAARFALRGLHEALCSDLQGTGVWSTQVTFGEVSSSYFDANPDSHDKVPRIAVLVPTTTPKACAQLLVKTVGSRRREVVAPFMLRVFYWTHRFFPGLVRMLVAWTQRSRRARESSYR